MARGRPKKQPQAVPPERIEEFQGGSRNAERLDKLPFLAARIDTAKSRSDDARSDLGNIYHQAETDGFNRRALKDAVRLREMEPAKRNDYLSSLAAYCDKLGIWAQGDLLGDEPRIPEPPGPPLVEGDQRSGSAARGIGKTDGRRGTREGEHLYPEGTPYRSDYELGWLDGQREIVAQQHGMDPSELEPGPTAH
jgi:uncharacterized protein (UPF0335 family)